MQLLPRSPRKRRRLAYAGSAAGVVIVVAVAAVVIGNSAGPRETAVRPGKAQVYRTPKAARATPAEKRAAAAALEAFATSAITRRDLAVSWRLGSPEMRSGTTRTEWLSGNLPVVPYPATEFRALSLRLTASYVRELDYDVLVLPKTKKGEQRVYSCQLSEHADRWLVDYCYPRTSLG